MQFFVSSINKFVLVFEMLAIQPSDQFERGQDYGKVQNAEAPVDKREINNQNDGSDNHVKQVGQLEGQRPLPSFFQLVFGIHDFESTIEDFDAICLLPIGD